MGDPPAGPRLAVAGAGGRLGSAVRAAAGAAGLTVCAIDDDPAVIVDAGHRDALAEVTDACRRHRAALVECVSGLGAGDLARLSDLALAVPVVRAVNLTAGHWLQVKAVRLLAAATAGLPVQASVLDRHPVTKRDRPSATASALAGQWPHGPCDPESLRHGPAVSEHSFVLTLGPAETLAVHHDVRSLAAAAAGALLAARWAGTAPAGLHDMEDVYDTMTEATDVHGR